MSVDSGVAGYVYRTGEACFLDSGADSVHFNDTVDLNTGKGGLFTLPLQTLSHEIIGVIQVIHCTVLIRHLCGYWILISRSFVRSFVRSFLD